jgi:hypothetical protein
LPISKAARQGIPDNRGICRIQGRRIQGRFDFEVQYTEYTLSDIRSIHIAGTSLAYRTKPNPIAGAIPWIGIALAMGFHFMP